MAKQYRPLDSGLMVPDWMPMRDRRRVDSSRGMIFTPGGACPATGCHCPEPPCIFCTNSAVFSAIELDVSDVANDNCADCEDDYNGIFSLSPVGGIPCLYNYSWGEAQPNCYTSPARVPLWVGVFYKLGADYIFEARWTNVGQYETYATFRYVFGTSVPDCSMSSQSLTLASSGDTECDWSSAAVEATTVT